MFSTSTIKQTLSNEIAKLLSTKYEVNQDPRNILRSFQYSNKNGQGDISLPCFQFAKVLRKNPKMIADDFVEELQKSNLNFIKEIKNINGFLNIFLDKDYMLQKIIKEYSKNKKEIVLSTPLKDKKTVIEYSSPNIAKPFGIGHLISTAIGESLKRIYTELGSNVTALNYLGDWGTQFGKVLTAYYKWGDKDITEYSTKELVELYVKFHDEEEKEPKLTDEARENFRKLENTEGKLFNDWKALRETTINELKETYKLLNVEFTEFHGESMYQYNQISKVIKLLEDKEILELSEGAKVVFLDDVYPDKEIPPILIIKSNGTTNYSTRDISALFDRYEKYDFDKILYIVGDTQNLHFQQVFGTIKKLNAEFKDNMEHVPFGLMTINGAKMATRKGTVLYLDEIYNKIYEKALEVTKEKGIAKNAEEVAKKLSVGALNFTILKNNRVKDIDFNFDTVLSFEGETSVYLQYTISRINSVLTKLHNNYGEDINSINIEDKNINFLNIIFSNNYDIISHILKFDEIVLKSAHDNEPSQITRYLLDLASLFNSLYAKEKFLVDDKTERQSKIIMISLIKKVFEKGMYLLNIPVTKNL